ncbi:BspA family leucine-rich repeat surface protein [Mycoplasma leachii]|uniref:BspA family leucine-rich repeat surface protein n=1 Tax=Mycoplasma leachii TaxID=2105 RepID=UPI000217714A
MKKLLTILTSCSTAFLVFASTTLVKNSNNKNIIINYNSKNISKEHKIQGDRLTEIGYKTENGQVRIKQIPHTVKVIAAQLPTEITSLKGAFQARTNNIIWTVDWDTSRITNMNSMFYNTTWFNNDAILKWDTSNVTDMGEMFAYSKDFNHNLSSWDVSNVTNMERMFLNSTKFNNGNKPLEWGPKLKKIKNMKEMFKDAKAFKQNLNSWLMKTEVNNNDFGLDQDYQPKWLEKTEAAKPEISTEEILSPKADEALESPHTDNNLNEITKDKQKDDSKKINILEDNTYKIPSIESKPIIKPEKPTEESSKPDSIPNSSPLPADSPDNSENTIAPKKPEHSEINNETIEKNESLEEDKIENPKNDNNLYKIPAKPNTIIKPNSPSAGVIAGVVLGTFTVLGIAGGTGYYYRKNLKNFYLNSADKTKNLYFKSKEKIKDKLSKIKSKK